MSDPYDCAVVGGGVMGCTTALYLARGGMRVALLERGGLCREASGTNAGTLTLQMTRSALIPYAIQGWEMWKSTRDWLAMDLGTRVLDGLSVAFTDDDAQMLEARAASRRAAGAPVEIVDLEKARALEPGLSSRITLAAYCPVDGFVVAYLTGLAYRRALLAASSEIYEHTRVTGIEVCDDGFKLRCGEVSIKARRLVLAGGVWLEEMLGWLGVRLRIQCLVNQLIVTERMRPVLRTVLGVANGKLSLKQFDNGTVLIGGGWQGIGDPVRGGAEIIPEQVIGNIQLACYALPALSQTRVARIWLGLEAETDDALPIVGAVPGVDNAYVIGSVHSGYTSGPYFGKLLAEGILGQEPELPLFDPVRLTGSPRPGVN